RTLPPDIERRARRRAQSQRLPGPEPVQLSPQHRTRVRFGGRADAPPRDGARRRALAHVEATVQEIHKAVTVIDEADFRKEVLNGFMDGYVVSALYGEDVPLRALAQ